MGFELYEKTRKTGVTNPKISLTAGNMITFNSKAVEEQNLGEVKAALLYFDREQNQIKMDFVDSGTKGAIKARDREGTLAFNAVGFANNFEIKSDKARKLEVVKRNKQDIILQITNEDEVNEVNDFEAELASV